MTTLCSRRLGFGELGKQHVPCTCYSQVEQDQSKVSLADLDSMLAGSELRGLKEQFWVGHKLWFPAEVQPSDAVVSRISRELFGAHALHFRRLEGSFFAVPARNVTEDKDKAAGRWAVYGRARDG